MSYPHGGAATIWRDVELAAPHNPDKAHIRDWGGAAELGMQMPRTDESAARIAELPNGSIGYMDGQPYLSDSDATGTDSVTDDLTVDGLRVPLGLPASPLHYGCSPIAISVASAAFQANDLSTLPDSHARLQRMIDKEDLIAMPFAAFMSSGNLALRDSMTIAGRGGLYSRIYFADDVDAFSRSETDIENLTLRDFGAYRLPVVTERVAFDVDNARHSRFERLMTVNFADVFHNARTVDGAWCWYSKFIDCIAYQCKRFYWSPHYTSGATFRSNGNEILGGYAGDVGMWEDHVAAHFGGIGNVLGEGFHIAQSGTNVNGAGLEFGEFSSGNKVHVPYHEGSAPKLIRSLVTSSARQNHVVMHNTDTTVNPTIDDPFNSVSFEPVVGVHVHNEPLRVGPTARAFNAPLGVPFRAAIEAVGDATVPAIRTQSRDGVASSAIVMATAKTDTGGTKTVGLSVHGVGGVGAGATPQMHFDIDGTHRLTIDKNGVLQPATDGAVDMATGANRFDDYFGVNATIQTSDRREKQDITELTEAEVAVALKVPALIRRYRWKTAVADKGDAARFHFGVIAQELMDLFTASGLDWSRYGIFIHQTWWQAQVTVPQILQEVSTEWVDPETQLLHNAGEVDLVEVQAERIETHAFRTEQEAREATSDPDTVLARDRFGIRSAELDYFVMFAMAQALAKES